MLKTNFYMKVMIVFVLIVSLTTTRTVMTAKYDRLYDERLNSIDPKINNNLQSNDKCEVRVVTSGVCSVNNHLIKPKIIVKQTNKISYIPVYAKPPKERRFRNMENTMTSVRIGEQKANEIVDEFLLKFKDQFRRQIDPMIIKDFGAFDLDDIGTVKVYDLILKGISNVKRDGSVVLHSNSQMNLWSINTNLSIDDIIADFKVDAQLKSKVFINGWTLQILIKRCLLNAIFELDLSAKRLTLTSLFVNSLEEFTLNSENLSQPFAEVVQHILDRQMKYLKAVISTNAQKYFSQTLMSFDVTKIVDQMNQMRSLSNQGMPMSGMKGD